MRRGQDPIDQIDEAQGARLARYVAGRSSPEEAAEVRAWVAADPRRAELLEALEQAWMLAREADVVWDVDAAWEEVRRRREARRLRPQPALGGSRRSSPSGLLRAAAIAALALGGTAVWALVARESAQAPREVAMHEYATGRAQRARVRLPDGTGVVLSVESRLRVPEDYGRRSRDVYLEGEARFDVQHDARRPFRVHAAGVVAEDLGTVFGVRAYPDGTPVTVVVAEGVVEVKTAGPEQQEAVHRLDPGQLARVGPAGEVRIERDVDAAEYLAFAEGRLVFRNTPLGEAAAQLGRWYNLDVRVADPALAALPLTASFRQEPIADVLNLIALSLGVRHERDGAVVTFHR
jgi:transmembrane sensor